MTGRLEALITKALACARALYDGPNVLEVKVAHEPAEKEPSAPWVARLSGHGYHSQDMSRRSSSDVGAVAHLLQALGEEARGRCKEAEKKLKDAERRAELVYAISLDVPGGS